MPVIKSSKKRVRQAVKKTARNNRLKRNVRLALQTLEAKLAGGQKTDIANAQAKIHSLLDTAAKKNIFHKNKVARRKSQIAKAVRAGGESETKPKKASKAPSRAGTRSKRPSTGKP